MKRIIGMIVIVLAGLFLLFRCDKKAEIDARPISMVYFTQDLSPEGLVKLYQKVNKNIQGHVAIKLHSGEPHGPNILPIDMVAALQKSIPGSVLADTNSLTPGGRDTTQKHRETLRINGLTFAPFDILDEDGGINFPVNGKHLREISLAKHLKNYASMVVLTHFKGDTLSGFGGSLKNIATGNADLTGKRQIHKSTDTNLWGITKAPFMERMVESAKATIDYFKPHIVYINVLRNMSVDCDCAGQSAAPVKAHDIGILASTDPVALDQATIDMVYALPQAEVKDLKERIESREGLHQLEYAEELKLGTRLYKLVSIDNRPYGIEEVKQQIQSGTAAGALLKSNKIVAPLKGKGIQSLMSLLYTNPNSFKDASLVDKVVGRAVALIAAYAGVRTVYGEVMSEDALQILQENNIPASYGKLVPKLTTKGKEIDPIDAIVYDIVNPEVGVETLKRQLMN